MCLCAWRADDENFMALLHIAFVALFAVFPDAQLPLAVGVLPARKHLMVLAVHGTYLQAVVVGDEEPADVVLQQRTHLGMVKRCVVDGKVGVWVNPFAHARLSTEVVGWIKKQKVVTMGS